jgi:hypothetical protein
MFALKPLNAPDTPSVRRMRMSRDNICHFLSLLRRARGRRLTTSCAGGFLGVVGVLPGAGSPVGAKADGSAGSSCSPESCFSSDGDKAWRRVLTVSKGYTTLRNVSDSE